MNLSELVPLNAEVELTKMHHELVCYFMREHKEVRLSVYREYRIAVVFLRVVPCQRKLQGGDISTVSVEKMDVN